MLFAEPATQPDFYRDPLWQFIGAILGLIAIVATVIIFYLQRQKKSLAYEIQTNTPVLTVDEQVAGKVKVLYEEKPIENAQLIIIRLINNGNQPIISHDYERDFSCTFGDNSKILSSEIIETSPEELEPELMVSESQIILEPLLMNKKDYLVIKTLVANSKGKINIDARIIGVNKISLISESFVDKYELLCLIGAYIFLILSGYAIFILEFSPLFILVNFPGLIVAIYFILKKIKLIRRKAKT